MTLVNVEGEGDEDAEVETASEDVTMVEPKEFVVE